MGSEPRHAFLPDADESPAHEVEVAPFRIGLTPVTNAQYRAFVEATAHRPPGSWPGGAIPAGQEAVPVTYVSWHDARAFCSWAGGRLPTEAEWEAAAGGDGRLWPWGDVPPSPEHAVFERGIGGPAPVGRLPAGAAPCGALDPAGNVAEWVSSAYRPYPYDATDGRETAGPDEPRVVRGGSYLDGPDAIRCSYRRPLLIGAVDTYVGFRVAARLDDRLQSVSGVSIDLAPVPGGRVTIGRDPVTYGGEALADELPAHDLELPAFELSRTPVTNAQYAVFVRDTDHRAPAHWPAGEPPPALLDHPVTWVDHADASAFYAWLGARLPTEAEWERAARGAGHGVYPWGDEQPLATGPGVRATFGGTAKAGATTPVGTWPDGASEDGLLDLAGNVWEWVSTAYHPYPYDAGDGREDTPSPEERVLRGGSYASPARHLRCAARSRSYAGRLAPHIGFRVARDFGGPGASGVS
jgi:formylglycine-generating enzyme required for sulfatase activity